MTVAQLGKNAVAASRPRHTQVQKRLVRILARPGRALESWMNVLRPSAWPAYTGGSDVKPPIPSTASAPKERISRLHRRTERHSCHKNRSIRGDPFGGLATAGIVAKRSRGYFALASASTGFSEITSCTSWPRASIASATAMPGKR